MSSSLQRLRRAGLARPVMTPVRSPAVTAGVRPWPSCASKFFSSSAEPSDCDSNVTLPSVSVPSTSISSTRICFARLASFLGIFFPRVANAISLFSAFSMNSVISVLNSFFKLLHQLQGPQIIQIHHTHHPLRFIRDNNCRTLAFLHQVHPFT